MKELSKYSSQIRKIAKVFACRSNGLFTDEDLYHECIIRFYELDKRYGSILDGEFVKVLNWSLHNLCINLLKYWSKPIVVDPVVLEMVSNVIAPAYTFYFREAVSRLLESEVARSVFDFLLNNFDVVEDVRERKNESLRRRRQPSVSDIIVVVSDHFVIPMLRAKLIISQIKSAMRVVYGIK